MTARQALWANTDPAYGPYVPHPVAGMNQPPMDDCGASPCGPSCGDPVNLATGEEQYNPSSDISVYNPNGPSVVWSRLYNSLRAGNEDPGNQGLPASDATEDFGRGWSHNYNYYVVYNSAVSPAIGAIIMPNKGRIPFTVPVGTPRGQKLSVAAGAPCAIYTEATGPLIFRVHWANGAVMRFVAATGAPNRFFLTRLTNARERGFYFYYADAAGKQLARIADDSGADLLTIERGNGLSQGITRVVDRYRRAVYYKQGYWGGDSIGQLTNVSWIFSDTAPGPYNDRVSYNYQQIASGGFNLKFLTTMWVPSPTGNGTATMNIEYDSATLRVKAIQDANRVRHEYTVLRTGKVRMDVWKDGYRYLTQTTEFDSAMNITTETNGAAQKVAEQTFGGANPFRPNIAKVYTGGQFSPLNINYTWDTFGNPLSLSNTVYTTTYSYDFSKLYFPTGLPSGRQVASRTPEAFTWNDYGELTQTKLISPVSQTSPAALEESNYHYTAMGDVDSVDLPGPWSTARRTYTLNYVADGSFTQTEKIGQPLIVTDAFGRAAHFRYNERGLVTDAWDALNLVTSYSYNIADQVTDVYAPASPAGQRTRLHYIYQFPGGPLFRTELYDESGAQIRHMDYAYGFEGELLGVSGDTPNPHTVQYNPLYQISKFLDGKGNATNYTYDTATGFLTRIDYPGGNYVILSNYDPLGRYHNKSDSRGQTFTYTYDGALGQISAIDYASGQSFYPGYNITTLTPVLFGYDAMGRLSAVYDSWVWHRYYYNDADLITTTTTTMANWSRAIQYQYNPDGSRATMQIPIAAGNGIFRYYYDAAGRPASLVNPFGETTYYTHDAGDRMVNKVTAYNGVEVASVDRWFDHRSRVTVLNDRRLSNVLALFGEAAAPMQFDGAGNRTQLNINSAFNFNGFSFTGSRDYAYVPVNGRQTGQVTRERFWPPSGSIANYVNVFNYDDAGNLLDFTNSQGASRLGKIYGANNQPSDFTFDGNGNQTQRSQGGGTMSVAYDWEDNATQFTGGGVANPLQLGYTNDGRRIWRQQSGVANSLRYFLYDGMQPVAEIDGGGAVTAVNTIGEDGLISRTTGTFAPSAASQTNIVTVPGAGDPDGPGDTSGGTMPPPPAPPANVASSGPMIPLANGVSAASATPTDSYTSVFYLFDERGNTAMRLNRSGAVLSAHVTDAYGATLTREYASIGTAASDPYTGMGAQFGYEKEPGLNLYRCGFRHYDPMTGRWLTRDPIGYGGGQNLYAYVSGNPIMGIDPSGMVDLDYGMMQDALFALLFGAIGSDIGGTGGGLAGALLGPGGAVAGAITGSLAGGVAGAAVGVGISRQLRGADALPLMSGAENPACGNRKEAFNTAKSRAGIPRSQQPVGQWKVGDDYNRRSFKNYRYSPLDTTAHGLYFFFDTPQGPRVIAEHLNDGAPHFHAGAPKDPFTFTDFKQERYQQVGGSHHIYYGN